jgi:hypothetical protein
LAAFSLTGGRAVAASQTASINVSISIEARCTIAWADGPGRRGDLGFPRAFTVQCTDSTPYRVLFVDGPLRQCLDARGSSASGTKFLEIAY